MIRNKFASQVCGQTAAVCLCRDRVQVVSCIFSYFLAGSSESVLLWWDFAACMRRNLQNLQL